MEGFKEASINDIDNALSNGNGESIFMKLETGKTIKVRILPAFKHLDDTSYLKKYKTHNLSYVVDPKTEAQVKFMSVYCPTNDGEECPFCSKARKIANKVGRLKETNPDEAKKLENINREFFSWSNNIICRVIDRAGSPVIPKFLNLKKNVLKVLKLAFSEGKIPVHPVKGNDIVITKDLNDISKGDAYWNIGYVSKVLDDVTVFDEDQWKKILNNVKPFSEAYKKNKREKKDMDFLYQQVMQKFKEKVQK